MKTIKIIDLLNKIANGEEVPKEIKYDNERFGFVENFKDYFGYEIDNDLLSYISGEDLNNEIEILDEEDEFEDFNHYIGDVGSVDESNIEEYIHILFYQQSKLIKNQKKIIEKLNKE